MRALILAIATALLLAAVPLRADDAAALAAQQDVHRIQTIWPWATKPNWDSSSEASVDPDKVADVEIVDRTPLFDNLPFLTLKPGDHLVTARPYHLNGKGVPPAFSDRRSYFLASGNQYYPLWAREADGTRNLLALTSCHLLTWEPTLEHATALYQLTSRGDAAISRDTYQNRLEKVRLAFPEYARLAVPFDAPAPPEAVRGQEGPSFRFQRLVFRRTWNAVFKETVMIGPTVMQTFAQPILVGPHYVNPLEFLGHIPQDPPVINDMGAILVSPEMAKVKRAEYDHYIAFDHLMRDTPAPSPAADPTPEPAP